MVGVGQPALLVLGLFPQSSLSGGSTSVGVERPALLMTGTRERGLTDVSLLLASKLKSITPTSENLPGEYTGCLILDDNLLFFSIFNKGSGIW